MQSASAHVRTHRSILGLLRSKFHCRQGIRNLGKLKFGRIRKQRLDAFLGVYPQAFFSHCTAERMVHEVENAVLGENGGLLAEVLVFERARRSSKKMWI